MQLATLLCMPIVQYNYCVQHIAMNVSNVLLIIYCSGYIQEVKLPDGFVCDQCTLQLVRQAAEWQAVGGYRFWSCSDISIRNSSGN